MELVGEEGFEGGVEEGFGCFRGSDTAGDEDVCDGGRAVEVGGKRSGGIGSSGFEAPCGAYVEACE